MLQRHERHQLTDLSTMKEALLLLLSFWGLRFEPEMVICT